MTKAPVARALIFDCGGVISRTPFEPHALTEASFGQPAGSLTWREPFDPATDPPWRDMQADRISERDYWYARTREMGEEVGKQWTEFADSVRAARRDAPAEVIVDATYSGILKPDTRAYQIVLDKLDLGPGDRVFIDDQDRNIKIAERVGLRAVPFDVSRPAESYARVRRAADLKTAGAMA